MNDELLYCTYTATNVKFSTAVYYKNESVGFIKIRYKFLQSHVSKK